MSVNKHLPNSSLTWLNVETILLVKNMSQTSHMAALGLGVHNGPQGCEYTWCIVLGGGRIDLASVVKPA